MLTTILLVLALSAVPASAATPDPFADPEFKKQFLGAYGIHPDVEPSLTAEERSILEKVYPLMSTDPGEAARQIGAALKPGSTALFDFILGGIAFQEDLGDEAAAYFEAAVTKFPSFRRAWKMLGVVRVRLQKPQEAIDAFTRMIQLGGGDAVSYGLLGDAYSFRQDHLAAEGAYRNALLLDPESAGYRIGLVRAVLRQEKYEEAVGLLRVLLEKNPERSEFLLLQAGAYLGLKKPLAAAENYEMVARMGKGTADTMNVLGDLYLNESLPNLAEPAYEKAFELAPGDLARPLRNVETLLSRGATEEARALVTKIRGGAAGLDDEQKRKLLKLEARIALAEGKGDDAARVLEEVVSLDPLDGDALILLGQHSQRAGDLEKASLYYERAGNIESFEAQGKARQGQLLATQGKYGEALPLLKRARDLKPNDQLALYIEQVERLARTAR